MKKIFILVTLVSFVVFSCKKNNDEATPEPSYTQEQKENFLQNIGDNLILPSYQEFNVDSDSLKNKCKAFCTSPSLTTLTAAQEAWKKAKLSWKRCELFNSFGPAEQSYINTYVDYPSINTSKIETNISTPASSVMIDSTYIETRSSTSKGLGAMEYLLFDRADNSNTVTNYTSASHFENRKEYLKQLSINLYYKASLIYNKWSLDGENYITEFKTNPSNDIDGSLSLLLNSVIQQLDVVKTVRIGNPLGKTTGTADPASVEAYYSRYSFECIKADLTCVQYIMTGTGYGAMNGKGLNTLMSSTSQKQATYDTIIANLAADINYTESIPVSLEQAALDNNADANSLYNSAKQLIKLLKSDLCPSLNISLLFTDNDGD